MKSLRGPGSISASCPAYWLLRSSRRRVRRVLFPALSSSGSLLCSLLHPSSENSANPRYWACCPLASNQVELTSSGSAGSSPGARPCSATWTPVVVDRIRRVCGRGAWASAITIAAPRARRAVASFESADAISASCFARALRSMAAPFGDGERVKPTTPTVTSPIFRNTDGTTLAPASAGRLEPAVDTVERPALARRSSRHCGPRTSSSGPRTVAARPLRA